MGISPSVATALVTTGGGSNGGIIRQWPGSCPVEFGMRLTMQALGFVFGHGGIWVGEK